MPKYSLAASQKPHVAVIGAGAMGLLYGAFLSTGDCRVTMLARRAEVATAITRRGIDVEEHGKVKNYGGISAVTDLRAVPPPDLLIVCVKGPDTAAALQRVGRCIPPEACVLTLQNGLGHMETIAEYVPEGQILAGVSYLGSTLLGSNLIRIGGRGMIQLGEPNGTLSPRLLAIAQLFERSGLKAGMSDNIQGLIWTKALVNAAINPVAALTRLKNGELAELPESRALISVLAAEVAALAEKLGIKLDTEDPVGHTINVARATGANTASMLQDILQGKKTEIENISGVLIKKAQDIGFDLPMNRSVSMLVRLLERSNPKGH